MVLNENGKYQPLLRKSPLESTSAVTIQITPDSPASTINPTEEETGTETDRLVIKEETEDLEVAGNGLVDADENHQVKDWDDLLMFAVKENAGREVSSLYTRSLCGISLKKSSHNRIKQHIENKHSKWAGSPLSLWSVRAKSPNRIKMISFVLGETVGTHGKSWA